MRTRLNLGNLALEFRNVALAAEQYQMSLALFRTSGVTTGVGLAVGNLGLVALFQGDLQAAQALLEEALAISEGTDSRFNHYIWMGLGWTAQIRGDVDQAHSYLSACVKALGEAGEKRFLLYCLVGLVSVALAEHSPAGRPACSVL